MSREKECDKEVCTFDQKHVTDITLNLGSICR